MPGRAAEAATVFALAAIITIAMAAPVLRAPSERIFGMETVGRHYDPFTVMAQFAQPIAVGVYSQPVTDIPGALLTRLSGPVAAYNWLVLLSFPLSAAAAYLLGRQLGLSVAGATIAGLAYAFSPFHVAHAAYHVHIAQTQWIPLYLLALWRCLDDASPVAVGFLVLAAAGVTLSNFYAGLIMAVISPVAVAAYWFFISRARTESTRRLGITAVSLLLVAASGLAYVAYVASDVVANRAVFAFPRVDLFRYSAKWWSYLVPPIEHPLLGAAAHRFWTAEGVREGLLEQQVTLGWGVVALGLIAIVSWLIAGGRGTPERNGRQRASLAPVPVLVILAVVALVCSLSPERAIGPFTFVRPSALLYDIVPMFRSYARFGVVVQLMAALLAGIGVDYLRRAGTSRARTVCFVLVALAVAEYTVMPSALWRDVLPTAAHRWVMRQAGRVRALDCVPLNQESASVQWLTGDRVTLGNSTIDCTEPDFSRKLAAIGYTHLLVRHDTDAGQWFAGHPALDGLRAAAMFADGEVFEVTARVPPIYTGTMTGFFPRERDGAWSWRWMATDATWTIVNTTTQPIETTLDIELSALHRARRMELLLDGRHVQALVVDPSRRVYQIGPLAVMPGGHELVFHPAEEPTTAGGRDRRSLSFAFGTWNWNLRDGQS